MEFKWISRAREITRDCRLEELGEAAGQEHAGALEDGGTSAWAGRRPGGREPRGRGGGMEGPQGGSRDCCPRKTALGQGVERRIQQRRRVGEAHPAQSPRSRHAVVDAQTKIVEDAREGDRRAKDGLLDPWVADPPLQPSAGAALPAGGTGRAGFSSSAVGENRSERGRPRSLVRFLPERSRSGQRRGVLSATGRAFSLGTMRFSKTLKNKKPEFQQFRC